MGRLSKKALNARNARNVLAAKRKRTTPAGTSPRTSSPPPPPLSDYPEEELLVLSDTDNDDPIEVTPELQFILSQPDGGWRAAELKLPGPGYRIIDETKQSPQLAYHHNKKRKHNAVEKEKNQIKYGSIKRFFQPMKTSTSAATSVASTSATTSTATSATTSTTTSAATSEIQLITAEWDALQLW